MNTKNWTPTLYTEGPEPTAIHIDDELSCSAGSIVAIRSLRDDEGWPAGSEVLLTHGHAVKVTASFEHLSAALYPKVSRPHD